MSAALLWPDGAIVPDTDTDNTERRYDRRSPFSDPKLWVSFSAVMLTIFLALFGYIATQLSTISANVQGIALATTKNSTEIDQLRRDLDRYAQEKSMLEARIIVVEKQNERTAAILQMKQQTP